MRTAAVASILLAAACPSSESPQSRHSDDCVKKCGIQVINDPSFKPDEAAPQCKGIGDFAEYQKCIKPAVANLLAACERRCR